MQGDYARALECFERVRGRTLAHGDMGYLMSVGAYEGEALLDCARRLGAQHHPVQSV
jgi:hypothetical protein